MVLAVNAVLVLNPDKDTLQEMRVDKKMSVSEIASELKMKESKVKRLLSQYSIRSPRDALRYDIDKNLLQELVDKGYNDKKIGEMLHMNEETIKRHREYHGIVL